MMAQGIGKKLVDPTLGEVLDEHSGTLLSMICLHDQISIISRTLKEH